MNKVFYLSSWLQNLANTAIVYLEFAKKSFQRQLQYRSANYAGFIVNTFFFMVRSYVFMALYENRGVVAEYNMVEAITFTGVTQAMIMVVGIFGSFTEIGNAVKTGEVATDLMKPVDYQFFTLSRQLGRSLYFFLFRGLPIFMVMVIFFPWQPPVSVLALILFLISLVFAASISFSFSFMIGLSAFWLMDIRGIAGIVMGSSILLSGFLVPISFFPGDFGKICEYLPFVGQSYVPVAIYLGKYTGIHILNMLIRQVIWTFILIIIGRIFMSLAIRKVVIQGG